MQRQIRLAGSWDDVPETVREDVRRESEGDLDRVELVDRPGGGYSVVVHDEPMSLSVEPQIDALDGDPAFQDVVRRTRPIRLSDG